MIPDLIASLGIGEETPEDGLPLLLPFFQPIPGRRGDPLQVVLDLPISIDQEMSRRLQVLGNVELLGSPLRPAGENEGGMLLAAAALAVGPAAGDTAEVGSGVKELLMADEGLEARTALAFETGHSGRSHGLSCLICLYNIRYRSLSRVFFECETAPGIGGD
jgi:hypothetical protein